MKREREQTDDRGEAGNEAKRQKPSGAQVSKPELRRQLSETGGAQNAEANGKIAQEDVVAELMKMGGRMALKALIKAFKKVLKNKVNKENFMRILNNIVRKEKDTVSGATAVVLKPQFGGQAQ